MKYFSTIFLLFNLLFLIGQQGDGGFPISKKFVVLPEIPVVSFAQPNVDSLAADDAERDFKGVAPWRFGFNHEVSLDFNNTGTWMNLPNGGKLWFMEVHCDQAKTVNLTLSNSSIPAGNQLFAYNPEGTFVLGKFTQNHLVDGALGMELVPGERVVVEYYVSPENIENPGNIHVSTVTHGYRTAEDYLRGFGDSGSCNMNVNCPDGQPYQNQRNAALMLVSGSSGFCSGSLINNTQNDGKPYVLTARHCGSSGFQNWIFRFNWQATACSNPSTSPTFQSLSGSVNRAGSLANTFDMRLVEITGGLENNTVPASYNPFFAGWDNSGDVPSSTFCIHHPSGDIKKIAFDDNPAVSTQDMGSNQANSVWQVQWDRNTTTEGGSSGSPLFDNYGRIIGQLWGGGASCSNLNSPDYYGRVAMSWNPAGSSNDQQLKFWLDPNNTGVTFINGYPEAAPVALDASLSQGTNWELTGTLCRDNVTPELKITNFGTTTITSAVINYQYSNGSQQQYNWNGSLTTGQSATFSLPNQNFSNGNYDFDASIASVNGGADENDTNDDVSSPFSIVANGYQVEMSILLDCYGDEISWRLLNQNETQVLQTGGPYQNSFQTQLTETETFCLAEACYVMEINDSYGDGLAGGGFCQLTGSVDISTNGATLNEITTANADFGDQEKLPFCLGSATNSISENQGEFKMSIYPNPTASMLNVSFGKTGQKEVKIYSALGVLIYSGTISQANWVFNAKSLAQGVYFIQAKNGNQTETIRFVKQ